MTTIFLNILRISYVSCGLILVMILLRQGIRKVSKQGCLFLWGIVGLRLCMPGLLESDMGILPGNTAALGTLQDVMGGLRIVSFSGMAQDSAATLGTARTFSVFSILAVVWMLGIGGMLVHAVIQYRKTERLTKTAIRYAKDVYLTETIDTPFVLGLIHPRIYIPMSISERSFLYIYDHESAHISRGDQWVKFIAYLILSVYWFHPLVWVSYILLCRDVEYACDEQVTCKKSSKYRRAYADTLFACSTGVERISIAPTSFAETDVESRIKAIGKRRQTPGWILLLCGILAGIIAAVFFTNARTVVANESVPATADYTPGTDDFDTFLALLSEKYQYTGFDEETVRSIANALYSEGYRVDNIIDAPPLLLNDNGQTFGVFQLHPDLVAVISSDTGKDGYVYYSELELPMPSSLVTDYTPEDRTINVYASDGITVVGTFSIGQTDGN